MRKSWAEPTRLAPADLDPIRTVAGDDAFDYALVVAAFHFINRIADQLRVDPELLPERLRRFEPLRRLGVRATSVLLQRLDIGNRPYPIGYDEAVAQLAPVMERVLGRSPADALRPVAARPKLIEVVRLALEERERSTLDADTLARVHRTVEAALPTSPAEREGFHARPADPVEAFAFVGTRYPERTTDEMVGALRRAGWRDLGILDLAIAVAGANHWARAFRLLGLDPALYYVGGAGRRAVA